MNVFAGVRSPQQELALLAAKSAAALDEALKLIAAGEAEPSAMVRKRGESDLAALLRATKIYADLLGRYRVWREFDAATRAGQYADPGDPETWAVPEVPGVPFSEAYLDLVTREPRLAGSAEEVAALYSQEHVFALTNSASLAVTERVQGFLARAKRERRAPPDIVETIAAIGDFTHSYALTVYRTNLATAYSAGRRATAQEEGVRDFLPAFRFTTARDIDVRSGRPQDNGENHAAMEGYLAPTDHAVWREWSPPLSWNCRCALSLQSLPSLERSDPRGRWRTPRSPVEFGAAKHPLFGRQA
mgnify:CR=1 FL=1